jgi:protocatechuate 3,4-dioxygenase beta subunit
MLDDTEDAQKLIARRRMLALVGSAALFGAAATSQTALAACVTRPRQTEGPFFVDEGLNRSDIRSDPKTGELRPGVPLRLDFRVSRLATQACAPLAGARVDVWHSDADGRYSDTGGFGFGASTRGQQFLRGYQMTDARGAANFLTIYPGAYAGRAVHVHFKIRTVDAAGRAQDFTSQLYFDDAFTERMLALPPYANRRRRWLTNAEDGIFRDGGRELLLAPEPYGEGYAATFDIAVPG